MNESFIGGGLARTGTYGFYVTLYPASDGSGKGTTLVHSYKISVKNDIGVLIDEVSGDYEKDIDVSKDTEFRFNELEKGFYEILINSEKYYENTNRYDYIIGGVALSVNGDSDGSINNFTIKYINDIDAVTIGKNSIISPGFNV